MTYKDLLATLIGAGFGLITFWSLVLVIDSYLTKLRIKKRGY